MDGTEPAQEQTRIAAASHFAAQLSKILAPLAASANAAWVKADFHAGNRTMSS